MRAIAHEVQDLKSVVTAVLDPSGVLLEANAGFMQLLGNSPARRIGANVALLFSKPAFAELAAARATEGGVIHRGTLSFLGADGQVLDLPGTAWRTAYGISVVAEYDIDAMRKAAFRQQASGATQRELRFVESSLTDKLTGTGNRDRLEQALMVEVSRVRRTGYPLSALMAVVDGFGQIVQAHGQPTADKVLARFGYLLRLLTRPTDIPARFEGEQFIVLLPHTPIEHAGIVARRIDQALATQQIEPLESPIAATFGIAQFAHGEDAETFLKRLQTAVTKAKKSPGDTIGVASA